MTDASELVKRLRAKTVSYIGFLGAPDPVRHEQEPSALNLDAASLIESQEEEIKRLRDFMQAAISEVNEGALGFENRTKAWLAEGLTARSVLNQKE